jgi:hypothetical protein
LRASRPSVRLDGGANGPLPTLPGMSMKIEPATVAIRVVSSMAEIDRTAWDACANPGWIGGKPIETAPCRTVRLTTRLYPGIFGERWRNPLRLSQDRWPPRHLVWKAMMGRRGCALLCEIPFAGIRLRWGWAERLSACRRPLLSQAGRVSVPFTPVTGPRLLTSPARWRLPESSSSPTGLVELCRRSSASSVHVTFLPEEDWTRLGRAGFPQAHGPRSSTGPTKATGLRRLLDALASRKRKALAQERRQALSDDITSSGSPEPRSPRRTGTAFSLSTTIQGRANGDAPI